MEDFISRWEAYLRNYEKKFVFTALKVCSALKVDVPQEELKSFFVNLYHQTFFSKDMDLSSCVEFIEKMKARGVDLKFISTKAFLLLVGDFSIQCFHKESSLDAVRGIVARIDEVLEGCSKKIIEDYEDISSLVRSLISHREKAVDFSNVEPEGEENKKLLEKFKDLKKKGESVELFNIYKGLHIRSFVPIMDVKEDGVLLEVGLTQLGVIAIDRFTLLKHPEFGEGIYGEVKVIEPESKRVKLWRFKRAEGKEEKRSSVRVKPKDIVEVSINSEKGIDLLGYILDISIDHVNVFIPKRELPFEEGEALKLSFKLEDCRNKQYMEVNTEGIVRAIRTPPKGSSVVFRLNTTPQEETKLSVYITCRQKEIVRDINEYVKEYLS
ncbi:hypothetical protein BCF55_0313 [Hydrogenivirga caldilitoris]|uniref:PilZ domain-containing protein n=1 Tax=Hydrogenivirga caldilitoris TaxID=246264 RepID=A0A497XP58_9AQUI|nr:hypothetical protein [Hydrogenivirga caldilitoris]RLJ70051.1 hypothetical protein BCF55_0313 [Hydrogenivirga caldilitoris]